MELELEQIKQSPTKETVSLLNYMYNLVSEENFLEAVKEEIDSGIQKGQDFKNWQVTAYLSFISKYLHASVTTFSYYNRLESNNQKEQFLWITTSMLFEYLDMYWYFVGQKPQELVKVLRAHTFITTEVKNLKLRPDSSLMRQLKLFSKSEVT